MRPMPSEEPVTRMRAMGAQRAGRDRGARYPSLTPVLEPGMPSDMANQVSRTVSLTAELDAFVGREVASGRFKNASEVVRAALRLMADHHVRLVPRAPASPPPMADSAA